MREPTVISFIHWLLSGLLDILVIHCFFHHFLSLSLSLVKRKM